MSKLLEHSDTNVWGHHPTPPIKKRKIASLWHIINDLATRFDEEHIFLLAAGISFNVLLCLIPLVLVAIFILSKVFDVEIIIQSLQTTLTQILPPVPTSQNVILSLGNEIRLVQNFSSTAGYIGIAVLLWTSSALFSSLRTGLNAIFDIATPKFFLVYKLKDIIFTLVVSVLILLSILLSPLIAIIQTAGNTFTPDSFTWFVSGVTATVISSVSSFILFFLVFRFVPNKPVPWYIIIYATAISVVLWESARFVFAWYLSNIASFGKFYGIYTVLVSSALWIYYSSLILLISAEVAEYMYERRFSKHSVPPSIY